mgnify:FL=1|tara:strand:+ start:2077 stop:2400 length:324 start_codon:yes stop_codon:yes gene_type:complete
MTTIQVTDATFEEEVLKSDKPVVLDFWAPWCGPCKQIGPSLEEISDEMKDKITVAKVNIDENPVTPTKYGVRGIPTMLVFKDGQAAATKVGAISKPAIVEWIEESIS